jgi:hypothetical protein
MHIMSRNHQTDAYHEQKPPNRETHNAYHEQKPPNRKTRDSNKVTTMHIMSRNHQTERQETATKLHAKEGEME